MKDTHLNTKYTHVCNHVRHHEYTCMYVYMYAYVCMCVRACNQRIELHRRPKSRALHNSCICANVSSALLVQCFVLYAHFLTIYVLYVWYACYVCIHVCLYVCMYVYVCIARHTGSSWNSISSTDFRAACTCMIVIAHSSNCNE